MTPIKEDIEASEVFDKEHKLPLIPIHNNPGIYCALFFRYMRKIPDAWIESFEFFWKGCVQTALGTVSRFPSSKQFPNGRGGNFSHDEILGWAACSKEAAEHCLWLLEKWWGWFPNEFGKFEFKRFFYRFIFLKPFLLMRLGRPLPKLWEKLWCLHVDNSTSSTTAENFDCDGLFKVWIMGQFVVGYQECEKSYHDWLRRMKSLGLSPEVIFKDYLKECPAVRLYAPASF